MTPRVMLLMICVLAVLLEAHGSLIHSAANHMHKLHLTSHSNFDGPYGLAAAANLSRWRSSLFAATMDFMASGDHGVRGRYDLLEPIVTCPPGTALERVGAPDPEDVSTRQCDSFCLRTHALRGCHRLHGVDGGMPSRAERSRSAHKYPCATSLPYDCLHLHALPCAQHSRRHCSSAHLTRRMEASGCAPHWTTCSRTASRA